MYECMYECVVCMYVCMVCMYVGLGDDDDDPSSPSPRMTSPPLNRKPTPWPKVGR